MQQQHIELRPLKRRAFGLALVLLLLPAKAAVVAAATAPTASASSPVTVGMEGQVEVLIPGKPLEARAVDDKARLLLRIAATRPHGTSTHYDLRYIGLEPGTYDLRTLLVTPDGQSPTNVAPIEVRVAGVLPRDHDGLLEAAERGFLGKLGGYRVAMTAVGVLWVTGLGFWILRRRSRRPTVVPIAPAAEPTFADRLRPLVLEASRGQLSTEGQARLERLLVAYWRDRLALHGMDATAALARLRAHPEAGSTLRQLERWLHHPAGASTAEVEQWLQPYRTATSNPAPAPGPIEPGVVPPAGGRRPAAKAEP